MKSYSFRLAGVLNVRRVTSVLARQEVARLTMEISEALSTARELDSQYQAACSPIDGDGNTFVAGLEHQTRLADMRSCAIAHVDCLREKLAVARDASLNADRQVKMLERLAERRKQEWLVAMLREDAAVLDDIATTRFARARQASIRDLNGHPTAIRIQHVEQAMAQVACKSTERVS